MRTLVLERPEHLVRRETEAPSEVPAGHARVRVHRIGVCGTDLHAFRGRQPFFSYPRILGHELGVEVLETSGRPLLGDRELGLDDGRRAPEVGALCAVEPYLGCGDCVACRRGKPNCCVGLRVLGVHVDGGMREEIIVPLHKLHASDRLDAEQLALVETLGIGAHAIERLAPEPGEPLLVIGAGPIGLSVVTFATLAGARVRVLDLAPGRRDFVARHFAIEGALAPPEDPADTPEAVREAFGGELPTAVIDATGNPASMEGAFRLVASGGQLVFVGLFIGSVTFDDPEFHRKELTLLASRNSRPQDFRRILGLLEDGRIDTRPWITHHAGWDDVIESFPTWLDRSSKVVKAIIEL